MDAISTHFEMLMTRAEQERIGATPEKDQRIRVLRVLSHYEDMRAELEDIATSPNNSPEYLKAKAARAIR